MKKKKKYNEIESQISKRDDIIAMYDRWLMVEQQNRFIDQYLLKNGFFNIAIYGVGIVGRHLLLELLETEIRVKYMIDINAPNIFLNIDIDILHPNAKIEDVDAIIITTAGETGRKVKLMLEKRLDIPVMLFSEVLENV